MYPAYIHTQATARNIDHAAIETYRIPSLILMEHAAIELWTWKQWCGWISYRKTFTN